MELHRRPLFLFAIAYLAGIVCAAQPSVHPVAGMGIAAGVLLAGFVLPIKASPRGVLVIAAVVFAVGLMRTSVYLQVPADDVSRFAEGKLVYITGRIASDPEPLGDRVRFVLDSTRIKTYTGEYPISGRVMVTLYQGWDRAAVVGAKHLQGASLKAEGHTANALPLHDAEVERIPFFGETIRVHGRFREPRSPSNPGAPDYAMFLARERVYSMLTAGIEDVSILRPSGPSPEWLALCFKSALASKALDIMPPVQARLLLSILFGNYALLPMDVQASFMRSGTMHLLAASGYNCAVVIGLFGWLMWKLTVARSRRQWLLIALVWGFTLAAGHSPSIVRAAIMVTAFMSAYLLWRAPDTLNIVLFSILVITGWNPLSLYDVGFQLSFAAVFAIVLVIPLLEPFVARHFRADRRATGIVSRLSRVSLWALRTMVMALVISVVVLLGTLPITAYYFNYLSVVGFVANALTAILVVLLTAAGISALALGFVLPVAGKLAGLVATGLAGAMLAVVHGLGSHPWSSVAIRSPSPVLVVLYYLVLLGVLEYAHRKAARSQRMAGAA